MRADDRSEYLVPEDLLLAVAYATIAVVEVWLVDPTPMIASGVKVLVTGLILLAAGTVAGRSSRPIEMHVINSVILIATVAVGYNGGAHVAAGIITLYTLATSTPTRTAVFGWVASMATIAAFFLRFADEHAAAIPFLAVLIWSIAWFVGRNRRARQVEQELRSLRDTQQLVVDKQAAELQLQSDRVRLAREVHDIVGHSVNVMVIHAAAAQRTNDPTAVSGALASIEDTGRAALEDLDRALGHLRTGPQESSTSDVGPNLESLDTVAESMTKAGLTTTLHSEVDATTIPTNVQLSAHRVVQEALTNALKHSNGNEADVKIASSGRTLSVEITDNGTAAPSSPTAGNGIAGMSERARMHDGDFTVKQTPTGAMMVHATFDLGDFQ